MKNLFTSASLSLKITAWAIGLFVFIAACFFYPSDARPDVFYFADAFFSCTIAMMILSFNRFFNKTPNEDDAANLATLGPTLFLVLMLLGISYTSLNKSMHGADETALILNFAYVGLLIAGFAFFAFIKTNVEAMRKQHAKPSNHLKWKNELSTLSVLSTHLESKKIIQKTRR